jgi:adenylate kinase
MLRLVLLGPPGAGKGTQARVLHERFGLKHLSTGDILRDNRARGTALGKEAEGFMERGELVPDQVIVDMIDGELGDALKGFVLDGFPRTIGQAEALDALLARHGWGLDAAVLFQADRETLLARLSARWTNPRNGRTYNSLTNPPRVAGVDDEDGGPLVQRDDDRAETVAKRLDVYEAQTKPLVEYYQRQGKLLEINGLLDVDSVTHALLHALDDVIAQDEQPERTWSH